MPRIIGGSHETSTRNVMLSVFPLASAVSVTTYVLGNVFGPTEMLTVASPAPGAGMNPGSTLTWKLSASDALLVTERCTSVFADPGFVNREKLVLLLFVRTSDGASEIAGGTAMVTSGGGGGGGNVGKSTPPPPPGSPGVPGLAAQGEP